MPNFIKKTEKVLRSDMPKLDFPIWLPFLIAAFVFFVGVIFGGGNIDSPSFFTALCTLLTCVLITIGGFFVIIRKEAPGPGSKKIKGMWAILIGVLVIIIFGCASMILLRELILQGNQL